MPENTISIALLSQAGESGRHLREALAESGTPIVYESAAADLDRDALEKSGARVVVVSLDAEVEAHLDDVYALLDDDRYNVIFDEAQVSSQLSGWEQARWARHLAAKILGAENADPPRPEGAEPVPQRVIPADPVADVAEPVLSEAEPAAAELSAEESEHEIAFENDAETEIDLTLEANEITLDEAPQPDDEMTVEDDDFGDLAKLLADPEIDTLELTSAEQIAPLSSSNDDLETVQMAELDLSEFDDVEEITIEEATPAEIASDMPDLSGFDIDSSMSIELEEAAPILDEIEFDESPSADAEADALGFGDLDDFAGTDDFANDSIELDSGPEPASVSVEIDLAESLENVEAAVAGDDLAELEMLELDLSDAPTPAVADAGADTLGKTPAPVIESAFAWELESTESSAQSDGESVTAKPTDFGIEKISAADYLAPEAEPAKEDDEPEFSLELIPLEEAVAPGSDGDKSHLETESWLDTSNKTAVSRVWVLGASIGGPEAVREFLAEIPANCPALFLLAQHMGAEFMEIMAQQLVRSTKLTVRTPSHGERVGHGDLLIVPIAHRIRIDRAGVVTLEALPPSDRPNLPSIDQVLQDVADRFGAKAGAIIFSGMAEDAAEGSRYLTEIGGSVFAQDPETCVISSMVDGVIETGVVSFVGPPKALAGKLLEVLGGGPKS